jgi:transposase
MSRLNLAPGRRRDLRRQLARARDVRLYRRTLAVLEFDRGRPVTDIADALGVTRQSVHNWVAAYARGLDPAALADGPRDGRPPLLTAGGAGWLRLLLARPPQWLGYAAVNWTVPLLREALHRDTGQRPSEDTVRRALHRLGFVWKRPRYVLAPDPDREKKKAPPAANRGPAAAERRAGGGRDRLAPVPAAAGRVVAAGPAG